MTAIKLDSKLPANGVPDDLAARFYDQLGSHHMAIVEVRVTARTDPDTSFHEGLLAHLADRGQLGGYGVHVELQADGSLTIHVSAEKVDREPADDHGQDPLPVDGADLLRNGSGVFVGSPT